MGKRQEAALETKRKIIAAVNELLKEKNLNEISIEDITTKEVLQQFAGWQPQYEKE